MKKLIALLLVGILLVTFVAWKQQDAPIEVTCGVATGGGQITGKGITFSKKAGDWIHEVATQPAPTADEIKRAIHGMFDDVLWFWLKSFIQSSRGQKIDPQILKKEKAAQKASADANETCTPCPTADQSQGIAPGENPQDMLTVAAGGGLSKEQRSVAATAIAVGKAKGIPAQGWVVAIAAGFQESGLRNLTYGDRDSVGVLQQRAGWGTVAQRMDVSRAFSLFYDHLKRINGWEHMPVTVAAQRVQVSGFPNAYAKWEGGARQLVSDLGGETPPASGEPNPQPEAQCVASGSTQTMATVAGFRKITDPTSNTTYNIPIPAGPRGVAINFALDQEADGDWYRWGAHGPDQWDCSGLVAGAWAKAGVTLTPQTESMRAQIPLVTDPQPGDLLYKQGHVQMYLGKIAGQTIIVEAPRTGSRMRVRPQWMQATAILDPTQIGKPA